MKNVHIAVIGGDGVGPEVISAALHLLQHPSLGLGNLQYTFIDAGFDYYQRSGECISESSLRLCKQADAVFYGANTNPPDEPGYESLTLKLRRSLELFANIRPACSLPVPGVSQGIDIVLFRENTECLYAQIERETDEGVIAERWITRSACERIIRSAFEFARKHKRSSVTLVHKANVLKKSCGLFRRVGFEIAEKYPEIETREMLVDAAAMKLIQDPKAFDVIVTTNLFGDILSDEASALVGGLGMAPSANIGLRSAMFEPVHGSAPDIAGTGKANPTAAILSACMMLEYLGYSQQAQDIQTAVNRVFASGRTTQDLGGLLSLTEFVNAVSAQLEESFNLDSQWARVGM